MSEDKQEHCGAGQGEPTTSDEVFAELGQKIADQLGCSMDEKVESAIEKLDDDDIIAFGLVALRKNDGLESTAQRAIDPEVVNELDHSAEDTISALHKSLCDTWNSELAER